MTTPKVLLNSLHALKAFTWLSQGCGDWQQKSNWYKFMSLSTRCLYREGDSAIFSPLQGQTSSALKYFWSHPAAGDCLPGVGYLLRFFKKHNLSLCQASPCCSERHLATTVPAGVKKATSAFCSRACLPLLLSAGSQSSIFLNNFWIEGEFQMTLRLDCPK